MKSIYHFEKLFDAGVPHEEALDVLTDYRERGAKVALDWENDGNIYLVRLLVSTLEDEDELDALGYVFGNADLDDMSTFIDEIGVNGVAFSDNPDTFTNYEDELLDRFGLDREDLEEITYSWRFEA